MVAHYPVPVQYQSLLLTKKKEILQAIMGDTYLGSKHRVIAYNDVTQEINEKVVCPKWQCTGTTTIIKPH